MALLLAAFHRIFHEIDSMFPLVLPMSAVPSNSHVCCSLKLTLGLGAVFLLGFASIAYASEETQALMPKQGVLAEIANQGQIWTSVVHMIHSLTGIVKGGLAAIWGFLGWLADIVKGELPAIWGLLGWLGIVLGVTALVLVSVLFPPCLIPIILALAVVALWKVVF